jgi:hypothetical protein
LPFRDCGCGKAIWFDGFSGTAPVGETKEWRGHEAGERIKELGDWRGKTLAHVRRLIHEADPDIQEERKWVKATNPGTPVFSHDGIVCTEETHKDETAFKELIRAAVAANSATKKNKK